MDGSAPPPGGGRQLTTYLLYEGRRIALWNPKEDNDGDWRIVRVAVRRFDAGFRRGPDYRYIGREEGNYWLERFAEMNSGVDGTILKPPIVYLVAFEDGRHRYAALRDASRRTIPVVMDAESRAHAGQWGYLWGPTSR
jgi:hypothetical protein